MTAMTTAQMLGQFRDDLKAEGFDAEFIHETLTRAADELLTEPLCISRPASGSEMRRLCESAACNLVEVQQLRVRVDRLAEAVNRGASRNKRWRA